MAKQEIVSRESKIMLRAGRFRTENYRSKRRELLGVPA